MREGGRGREGGREEGRDGREGSLCYRIALHLV